MTNLSLNQISSNLLFNFALKKYADDRSTKKQQNWSKTNKLSLSFCFLAHNNLFRI